MLQKLQQSLRKIVNVYNLKIINGMEQSVSWTVLKFQYRLLHRLLKSHIVIVLLRQVICGSSQVVLHVTM